MINRYRLLHPSRYVPILLATVAVVMVVPADTPTGDGTEAATTSGSVLAVAATQPPVHEEPAVRVAAVSQRPSLEELAAEESATTAPVSASAASGAPLPGELAQQRAMQSVEPAGIATTTPDEPADGAGVIAEGTEEEQRYQIARVGGSALNVRAGPSSANKKLFVLRPGEPVRVAEMDGNWARIVRADGDEGWAYARYLSWRNGSAPAETATVAAPNLADDAEDRTPRPAKVTANPEEQAPAGAGGSGYARIGSDVAAHSAPSPGAPQLFVLPAGERVKIAEVRGPWMRIVTNRGVSGWVRFR